MPFNHKTRDQSRAGEISDGLIRGEGKGKIPSLPRVPGQLRTLATGWHRRQVVSLML